MARWQRTVVRVAVAALGLAMIAGADRPSSTAAPSVKIGERDAMATVDAMRTVRENDELAATLPAASGLPMVYHGGNQSIGVSTGAPKVYLVFWGSQWGTASVGNDGDTHLTGDPKGMAPRLQDFFKGVGKNSELWSGTVTQYCEGVSYGATTCPANASHVAYPNTGAYAGVWADTASPSPASATSGQLGAEAVAAAAHFGNTTANANRNAQYVVVSPTGTHPDGFNAGAGFCAWHSYVYAGNGGSPYGTLMFTNMPYVTDMGYSCGGNFVNGGGAGTLDGVTIVEGHEYSETVTDPTLGAWYDGNGWENADRCAWLGGGGVGGVQDYAFSTGTFAVQGSWSNDTGDCRVAHAIFNVAPSNFGMTATVPASVRQGGSTTATINTTVATGSSLAVTLAAVNVPAGITPSFGTNPVNSGNPSTLTLNVGANVAPGRYTIKVNGTANNGVGTVLHSVNVNVTVTPANDFSLTGGAVTGRQGASPTFSLATHTSVGSALPITLSTSHVPAGVTPSFDVNPVTSGANATLTLAIAANAVPGRYPITVTGAGTSGGAALSHTATVTLTIAVGNDFSLTGGSVSAAQGATPTFALATHTAVGSPQAITFSTSHVPAGVTPSFVANPVTSDGTASLHLAIAANVAPGRYSMTVTGSGLSGGAVVTHTATVTLTVTLANDFGLSGGSVIAAAGVDGGLNLTTRTVTGAPQAVTLGASHVPTGVVVSFPTNPVTSGSPATVSLTIDPNTTPGRYPMTITATGASNGVVVTHSVSVTLTVSAPGGSRVIHL